MKAMKASRRLFWKFVTGKKQDPKLSTKTSFSVLDFPDQHERVLDVPNIDVLVAGCGAQSY